jgi:hypothetical protein
VCTEISVVAWQLTAYTCRPSVHCTFARQCSGISSGTRSWHDGVSAGVVRKWPSSWAVKQTHYGSGLLEQQYLPVHMAVQGRGK